MSMVEFDFFIEYRKGERNVVFDVFSWYFVNENILEDNVVVFLENSVISFMIIVILVDVLYYILEFIYEIFNNIMVCLYYVCFIF